MAAVEKRGESSYRLTVSCGYDKQGKKIVKRKTIDLEHIKPNKREEEANKQWILFKDEVEKGIFLDAGKISFEDFIEKWLKDYAEHELAPKTVFRYKEILNSRVVPALGHIKLTQLQPTHLNEFYNNLRENGVKNNKKYASKEDFIDILASQGLTLKDVQEKAKVTDRTIYNLKYHKNISVAIATGISESLSIKTDKLFNRFGEDEPLSEKTILQHHRLISSILTSAVQWQFILNNPASRVKAPRVEKKEARYFEEDQVKYIFALLQDAPIKYRAMIYLSLYGGMRMGELAGLDWSDLDLENKVLKIKQSSQYLPGEGVFTKDTKNYSSQRIIALPGTVISLMKEYKLWQNGEKAKLGDLWDKNSTRIFTTDHGTPMFPSTPSKWFTKFIKQHNEKIMKDTSIKQEDKANYLIDEINFHGLRHTSASLLIGEGTDIVTVSKRLGHSKTSTTTDIYAHKLRKTDVEAANKLEGLFNKKGQGKMQG
jgi:integrase